MFKKNKRVKIGSLCAVASVFFVVACGNSLTGQLDGDKTQASLGLKVQSSPTAITALTTALVESGNLTVESGQACVEEIRLKLPENLGCSDVGFVEQQNVTCEEEMEMEDEGSVLESKIKINGPFLFDLVTGTSTPSLADVIIPSGVYQEIEFRFAPDCALPGETTITLNGSMLDSSSATHAFEIALEFDDELKIESANNVQVIETSANSIFANLILEQWFAGVDFVKCIDDGDLQENVDGVIEINKSSSATGACENIYEDIREALKDAMEFEDGGHGADDSADDNGGDSSGDLSK